VTQQERDNLRAAAEAAISKDEWGKGRTPLSTVKPSLKADCDAIVLYDDGDWCAEVHDNLGLGISGKAMAELFAACNPQAVLALLDALDAAEARAALWKRAAKRHHADLNLHGLLRPRQYRVIDY
jgi:hypothetical protein